MGTTATKTDARPAGALLTDKGAIIKAELDSLSNVRKDAGKLSALFTLGRSLEWAESAALGQSNSVIAFAWGVSDKLLSNVQYGIAAGQFFARIGITSEIREIPEEVRAMLAGRVMVSERSIVFKHSDGHIVDEEWLRRFKSATNTTKLDSKDKNALVKGWLESAKSLEELEGFRSAFLTAQEAQSKEPLHQQNALAALTLVQGEPSEELIKECERILALRK